MPGDTTQRVKPSFLNALVDVSRAGAASEALYSAEALLEAVRQDVENLLNTRRTSQGLCDDLPEVANSLITYGVPDAASMHVITAEQRILLAREFKATIERFEPRLSHVQVKILAPATRKDRMLRLHITAQLNTEPARTCDMVGALEVITGEITMAGGS